MWLMSKSRTVVLGVAFALALPDEPLGGTLGGTGVVMSGVSAVFVYTFDVFLTDFRRASSALATSASVCGL